MHHHHTHRFVQVLKDRNKSSRARMFIKKTKPMAFAPQKVWRAGQRIDYMEVLDKNIVDVQVI